MKITINIDERTGNAIREFCKVNNLKQNQYLVNIIEKQFNIDRFGDLNEMISKKDKPVMKLVGQKTSSDIAIIEKQVEELAPKPESETNGQAQQKHLKRTLKTK